MTECPFRLGDRVRFTPNQRTIGWTWPSFDRLRIQPGDVGIVTEVRDGKYIFLDDDRGGFHWECFSCAGD